MMAPHRVEHISGALAAGCACAWACGFAEGPTPGGGTATADSAAPGQECPGPALSAVGEVAAPSYQAVVGAAVSADSADGGVPAVAEVVAPGSLPGSGMRCRPLRS